MEEIWKPIEGYLGYDVSNIGRIRTYYAKGRRGGLTEQPQSIRRPSLNKEGYLIISLKKNRSANGVRCNVHSLVASAFLGPKPSGLYACHNDGNKRNNVATNLRYDTNSSNQLDATKHNGRKVTARTIFNIVMATEWRPVKSR